MFTVLSKQDFVTMIEKEIQENFQDVLMIIPTLEQEIKKGLLWGIFSNEYCFSLPEKNYSNHDPFAYISYDIVSLAKQELVKIGELEPQFFSAKVDEQFQQKDIALFLDYSDCDLKVEEVAKKVLVTNSKFKATITLTLPDSNVVFESLIQGALFSDGNTWLFEYMDTYDAWKYKVMQKLYCYTWQIGGHGHWIQSDYNDTYIGQANIEIGDAGSVFIEVYEGKFKAGVDMY